MAKPYKPRIATGNDLREGDVVYFTAAGGWARVIWEAAVATTPEAAEDLERRAAKFPNEVVGVYLVEVALDAEGRPAPDHFREAFRMRGPSNYPHGKQAQEQADV